MDGTTNAQKVIPGKQTISPEKPVVEISLLIRKAEHALDREKMEDQEHDVNKP